MSKRWYGSVENRLYENKQFCKTIEVGTGATEFLWSDSHAYEVTKVESQEHIWLRRLKAIRTDNYGMSDWQDYQFESDTTAPQIEAVKRGGIWFKVHTYNKAELLAIATKRIDEGNGDANESYPREQQIEVQFKFMLIHCNFTPKQRERFEEGKTIKTYKKWDGLSIGIKQEYFDYSF